MNTDNLYQSPLAESPAKPDEAANWTDYSPQCNAAFKTALLIQPSRVRRAYLSLAKNVCQLFYCKRFFVTASPILVGHAFRNPSVKARTNRYAQRTLLG